MKKTSFIGILCAFTLLGFTNVTFASTHIEGKQYNVIREEIKNAPDVVEFFSFYCPPCAAFSISYNINNEIEKRLPKGSQFVKYHVSTMGDLGRSLTEAWSIAYVLGVQKEVEEPLFSGIQTKRNIKTEDDIRQVFIDSGISADQYDSAKNSIAVRAYTATQIKAADEYNVISTPSFYISGKYKINNNEIQSNNLEEYIDEFSMLINKLLKK
ncbi:DsbA family protein [Escherichia coli]|uniref:DsbA family protein n=1 Tax=Escherichia coli TaxID=562 RepID=UPI000BE615C4|nr:DsbA family protein [Escherichia coli]